MTVLLVVASIFYILLSIVCIEQGICVLWYKHDYRPLTYVDHVIYTLYKPVNTLNIILLILFLFS